MHHIIYISTAVRDLDDQDLQTLLMQARGRNTERAITGVLLYGQRTVVQVLEGPQEVIEELYQRIALDPRHAGIIKLADKPIDVRSFSDWSMGYEPLSSAHTGQLQEGYIDPRGIDLEALRLTAADTLLLRTVLASILGRPSA